MPALPLHLCTYSPSVPLYSLSAPSCRLTIHSRYRNTVELSHDVTKQNDTYYNEWIVLKSLQL